MQAPRKLYYTRHSCKSLKTHPRPTKFGVPASYETARALNITACQIHWAGCSLRPHLRSAEFLALKSPSHNDFRQEGSALAPDTSMAMRASTANWDCSVAPLMMDRPPIVLRWYDIWDAAIAVAGMCVSLGQLRTAIVQPKSHEPPTNSDSSRNIDSLDGW